MQSGSDYPAPSRLIHPLWARRHPRSRSPSAHGSAGPGRHHPACGRRRFPPGPPSPAQAPGVTAPSAPLPAKPWHIPRPLAPCPALLSPRRPKVPPRRPPPSAGVLSATTSPSRSTCRCSPEGGNRPGAATAAPQCILRHCSFPVLVGQSLRWLPPLSEALDQDQGAPAGHPARARPSSRPRGSRGEMGSFCRTGARWPPGTHCLRPGVPPLTRAMASFCSIRCSPPRPPALRPMASFFRIGGTSLPRAPSGRTPGRGGRQMGSFCRSEQPPASTPRSLLPNSSSPTSRRGLSPA